MDQNNSHNLLFMQLIMQNQQIALMSMGKIKNPVTGQIDKNLDFAKHAVDTLEMIKEKTQGNLSSYEDEYLSEILRDLQLKYVEEVKG